MRRYITILMAAAALGANAGCKKGAPCDPETEVLLNNICRDWCDPGNHDRGAKIDDECVAAGSVDPSYHEPGTSTTINNTTVNTTTVTTTATTNTGGAGGSTNTGTGNGTGIVTFSSDDLMLKVMGGDLYPQIKSQGFQVSGTGTFAMTAQNRLDVSLSGCNANVYNYAHPGWDESDLDNALGASAADLQQLTIPIASFPGRFGTFVVDVSCP